MKTLNRPFRVSEAAVRGVAIQVFLLSLTAIITKSQIPVIILIIDFAVRVILIPRFSLLALVSRKWIAPLAGFRRRQIVFKPKRFAAAIGLTMSIAALLLSINNLPLFYTITLSTLALFSSLEAFFKFCAGCKIFGLLMLLGLVKEDECPDCVYTNGGGI
ncbi:MAG: DUF4395 domain-containing protein [Spirochaetaceae bacterium]|nr:DUF4395 domain-containing protein [Spirochaetaceae bacterium]